MQQHDSGNMNSSTHSAGTRAQGQGAFSALKVPTQTEHMLRMPKKGKKRKLSYRERKRRDKISKRQRRQAESPQQTAERLKANRERIALRRQTESPQARSQRLKKDRERQAKLMKVESPQRKLQRLKANRERQALRRQTESPQARSQRLKKERERRALQRQTENPQARSQRLKEQRERKAHTDLQTRLDEPRAHLMSHPEADTTGIISLGNSVYQLPCLGDQREIYTANIMDPQLSNSACDFNEIGINEPGNEQMFERHTHENQPTVNKLVNIKQEVDTNQAITAFDMNQYLSMMKIPLVKRELPWNTHDENNTGHTDLVEEHMRTEFKQTNLPEVDTEGMSPLRTSDSSHLISHISHIKTEVISDNEHEMSACLNTEITS